MSAREDFYDAEIAPRLLEVAQLCEAQGMSIVAQVEYEPGKRGETSYEAGDASYPQRLVHWAARCHGNVDTLLLVMLRHAREHGHASIFLAQLGVLPRREQS